MGDGSDGIEKARTSPSNLRFSELIRILEAMGYSHRSTKGSHQVWTASGLPMQTLQENTGGKCKPYQVKQVLAAVELWEEKTAKEGRKPVDPKAERKAKEAATVQAKMAAATAKGLEEKKEEEE